MRILNMLLLATLVGIAGCETREQARRKQAANNLKQIGSALKAYEDKQAESANPKESDANSEAASTAVPKAEVAERRAEKTMKVSGEVAEFHRSPDPMARLMA